MITFNVLFTPGSVARLLPFALSLLQAPRAQIRVVSNGCRPDEVELMGAATTIDERVSCYALPQARSIEHGYALNHLFERFDDPHFAFVDSDVIASGDFMRSLEPVPADTAVFSAPPVWVLDDEMVVPTGVRFLGGRRRVLADGTPVGGTSLAVYERAAIESLWRQAPRGFAVQYRQMLPGPIRDAFSERGWRFHQFDSCRVVNLLLLTKGHRLENRAIPELHHIGGFSIRKQQGAAAILRDVVGRVRTRNGRTFRQIAGDLAFRTYDWVSRDEPDRARMDEHRRIVLEYSDAALDAILGGREPPSPPRTDSAGVNQGIAALRSALRDHYPPALAALREAERRQAIG